jgi:Penicillin binding protein transpeptidase domain
LGYIQVAGKTGTLKPRGHAATSSWFIGFAPSQKPAIAIALLLQIQDKWHMKAAMSARDLLRYYFARQGARNVTFPFEVSAPRPAEPGPLLPATNTPEKADTETQKRDKKP